MEHSDPVVALGVSRDAALIAAGAVDGFHYL